jgi:hypothetical protein
MNRVERWRALCDERIRLAALSTEKFMRGEPAGPMMRRLQEIAAELDALNVTPKERAGGLDGRAALSQAPGRAAPEPLDGRVALRQMERRWPPP